MNSEQISTEKKSALELKANEVIKSLDINSLDTVTNFGAETQRDLNKFSNEILNKIKAKDVGKMGEMINNLLFEIKGINTPNRFPILGKYFNNIKKIVAKYESVSMNIDNIVLSLDESRLMLNKDNVVLAGLYKKNLEHIDNLEVFIIAGETKLNELNNNKQPEQQTFIEALDSRIHDLKLTRMVAIQSLPQILLIQNNNRALEEKILSAINNTIPLWRNQVALTLTLIRQKKVIDIKNKIDETTDELLKFNSKSIRENTIKLAKSNERGIVKVETLKEVNDNLIVMFDEIKKIVEESSLKRKETEKELLKIETELKNRLTFTDEKKLDL
jgi:uncharacterized protein YaaN involved in tellurite resistance